jgi:hypothetical protein
MEIALVVLNIIAGFGCAYPLARFFGMIHGKPEKTFSHYRLLAIVYLVECLSMILGMGLPVFSVFLSFIWAAVFGLGFAGRAPAAAIRKASLLLSLYTCLPAATFIVVPIVSALSGSDVLSTEVGRDFGIPQYSFVPWPVRTILGFYLALIGGAVLSKTVITVGGVSLVVRSGKKGVPLP